MPGNFSMNTPAVTSDQLIGRSSNSQLKTIFFSEEEMDELMVKVQSWRELNPTFVPVFESLASNFGFMVYTITFIVTGPSLFKTLSDEEISGLYW